MKKSVLSKVLALTLFVALLLPAVPAAAADEGETFSQQLSALLEEQDDSAYFGSLELTLGSRILSLDGVDQEMDVVPDVVTSRTMLPIRAVAEAVGAKVDYDADTQTVVIQNPYGDTVRCPLGSTEMSVNGETYTLDVAAYAKNNRTYLPVRAVSEALDLDVEWVQETSSVIITAPYQSARILAWTDQLDVDDLHPTAAIQDGSGLWVLQFDTPASAKKAAERLEKEGILVQPDHYIPPEGEEESTAAFAQGEHYSWGVEDCSFDKFVAKNGEKFDGKYVVAVVDTGVDDSHPFLKGRVLSGRSFVPGSNDFRDKHYHGTHVAGTIIDCVGSAPVNILPVRVLGADGSGYDSAVVAGIKYAADQGADVINLSLGGRRGNQDVIDAAIDYAIKKNSVPVMAAGNENDNTSRYCPAHITTPGSIVVSAGDANHKKAYFSNYGDNVDLMAPGVNIKACVPGGSYKTLNGTSMATPHVSAAVVLLDIVWDDSLTPAELEKKLQEVTAYGRWTDKYVGFGFLDMSKASLPDEDRPEPGVTAYRYNVDRLSLQAGETAKVTVTAIYADGTSKDVTADSGLYSTDGAVATVKNGTVTAQAEGKALVSMSAAPSGVSIPAPISVTVTAKAEPEPNKPTVTAYKYNVEELKLKEGQTAQLKVTAVYSDGSTKDVTADSGLVSADSSVAEVSRDGTVEARKAGVTRLSISATPDQGISIPAPVKVTVTQDEVAPAPEVSYKRLFWGISETGNTTTALTLAKGRSVQVDVYGEKEDGTIVKLTKECQPYSSDPAVVTITQTGKLTAVGKGEAYLWVKSAPNSGLTLPPLLEIEVQ